MRKTVEARDILLLGHSERDKRGGPHRGGGRVGPGVDTKRGGLWRRAVGAQPYLPFELYLGLLRVLFS